MTAQVPDYLVYRKRKRALHSNPLEQYWNDARPRPELPSPHTACWRGYVATWLIEREQLFLTHLDVPLVDEPGLQLVFPNQAPPVPATWFTGALRLPDGEQLRYVHMGYSSTYASDTILELWHGQLVTIEEYDNRQKQLVQREVTPALDRLFGPDEAGFLRAIYLYPADDAPRLIYADWLEERSDPRASALRMFIETHKPEETPESAPDIRSSWLWWRLLAYPTS